MTQYFTFQFMSISNNVNHDIIVKYKNAISLLSAYTIQSFQKLQRVLHGHLRICAANSHMKISEKYTRGDIFYNLLQLKFSLQMDEIIC